MEKLEASTLSPILRARIACGGVEALDSVMECSEDPMLALDLGLYYFDVVS
jgi:hypothetical protein